MATQIHIVSEGQNIWDLTVQLYGSVSGLFRLLDQNTGLTVDSELIAGQEVMYDDSSAADRAIAGYFRERQINVNTGRATEPIAPPQPPGDFSDDDFSQTDFDT